MRIVFMGTPGFALPALEAIAASGHDLVCVYTQPPRPSGRGRKLRPSPVHTWAQERGIEVRTPRSLKKPEAQEAFAALDLDLAVVAAYGLILPPAILDAPRLGCWNVHASLLPRWRGASPIQRAIWAGDAQSGVCLMRMDAGLDTGPVLVRRAIPLSARETAGSLHDRLGALGAEMVAEGLKASEALTPTPQGEEGATYAHLLTRADGRIDWAKGAAEIDRQVRALTPWPGTRTPANFKILGATLTDRATQKPPGTLLDGQGHVACGGGSVLKVERLQPPGARAMTPHDAVNGGYLSESASL